MAQKYYKKNQESTVLETVVVGIFKALWFLIKLPFKGIAKKKGISVAERNEITVRRHKIESLLNSSSEIELKHAVLEADKLVDHILKLKGYEGDTFADKLRSAEESMSHLTYNEIWQGHKVRNRIAHESEAISVNELKSAIDKLLKYSKQV